MNYSECVYAGAARIAYCHARFKDPAADWRDGRGANQVRTVAVGVLTALGSQVDVIAAAPHIGFRTVLRKPL
jgi:hypothetical protein